MNLFQTYLLFLLRTGLLGGRPPQTPQYEIQGSKADTFQFQNYHQHFACVWPLCCDMLAVVGSSLKMVKTEPTTANVSQHIATRWPNAQCCAQQSCYMLR